MEVAGWLEKSRGRRVFFRVLCIVLVLLATASCSLFFLSSPVQALSIASFPAPLPAGQTGVPYSATLTATGTAPFTWGAATGLPPGLTLTPSGNVAVISGTPTTAGTFAFAVTVQDASPATATFTSSIVINPPPFTITTTSLPQGKEGTAYTASLSVSGGTAPYTWTILSGTLPSGLTLATTGYISGTPGRATAGTYTFTINVNDSSSPVRSAQQSLSIYIEKGLFQSTITVSSTLKAGSTKVFVGGTPVTILKGGESYTLSFDLGATRTISVEPLVTHPTDSGVRFRVQQESTTVSELQPNAEFSYYPEYLVDVRTEPSLNIQPQGSGWYRQGTAITASTKADTQGNPGIMYKFAYWLLPSSQKVNSEQVNFTVDNPTTLVAYYDTYYKLTTESMYGQVEGSGWYKAGTEARWSVINDKVPMEGIIGFFQGKYKAVNANGSEVMVGPKTITVFWEPDYTLPYVLIPLVIVVFILVMVGLYFLLRRQPRPQPQPIPPIPPYPPPYMPPPPPRPIPQQHTTVVMIGDKGGPAQKQLPASTKEQLMEKFGELLEKYETEIKASLGAGAKELPKIETIPQEKMIPAPQPQSIPPQPVVDAEFTTKESEEQFCRYTAKKLLRTVTSNWRQVESDTISLPSTGGEAKTDSTGLLVIWARDIYHEWEILNCALPFNHEGKHQGDTQIVYSLLNTVTEKKIYSSSDKPQPPTPHFTDGMPQVDMTNEQIVPPDDLPSESIK